MDRIADDEPPAPETLREAITHDRLWVVDDPGPVAYLLALDVDGSAHIEQVSVRADRARRGLGRVLIDHLADVARAEGLDALTLTTFTDVPWNAPYYRRLGFRVLTESEWTPGLRHIRHVEAAQGLDAWPRVCMRREL